MTETFEALNVVVVRQEDEVDGNYTKSGGYKVHGVDSDGVKRTFDASALNLNGFAFGVSDTMDIGEYGETVMIEQEIDGGYLNLKVMEDN